MSVLRKHLWGWAPHSGTYKQEKINLRSIATKVCSLTDIEREQLDQSRDWLIRLLCEEELKLYQRAKVIDVLLGDNNTKYF